jgi:hypothetical protein
MLKDDLAERAAATHANEATVVVVVVVELTSTGIVTRLVGVAAVIAADSRWRTRTGGEGRVAAQHGDTRAILGAAKRDHVLANVTTNEFAMLCATVCQDILYEIVAELITSDFEELATIHTERVTWNLLSIRGIRGRSGRASHMRSRYRSRNSLPPILRHFSMTLEAY